MKPIVVLGLSGSGKEQYSQALSEALGIPGADTNEYFRKFRAIPLGSNAEGKEVMINFLNTAAAEFPGVFEELKQAAEKDPADPKGRSKLHDSNFFRKQFGEDVFRLFEREMFLYLNEKGEFENKIVEPSSASLMDEKIREIFTANGFTFILADTTMDVILQKLVVDYDEHLRLSKEKGELVPIRGGYELAVREALAAANNPEDPAARQQIIEAALSEESLRQLYRLEIFRELKPFTVSLDAGHYINAPANALDAVIQDTIEQLGLSRAPLPPPEPSFNG